MCTAEFSSLKQLKSIYSHKEVRNNYAPPIPPIALARNPLQKQNLKRVNYCYCFVHGYDTINPHGIERAR